MSIVVEHLMKRYEGHPVVNNVSLEVGQREFFVLLGPSGSGKSTVLRMIAGLTGIDNGRVLLHGRDVTRLLPQQRDTGFVFQQYALFKHMTVGDNVEFALRIRGQKADARRRRRDELLDLVGLAGLARRMPHQLSGGQQQRVALARALAHEPAVLLLDEPFGALDAKIRTELRATLRAVQRETGTPTIFVTHDQEEAFELADRIGVMHAGRLLEVGPPEELYQRPQTEFVATFLGTANLLVGEFVPDEVRLGPVCFPLSTGAGQLSDPRRVKVLFRPEDVALAPVAQALSDPALGEAEVEGTTYVGSYERLRLRLPSLPGVRPIAPPVPFGSDSVLVDAMRSQDQARLFPLQVGQKAWIGVRRIHALTHPGLRLLLVTGDAPEARAALSVGGQLARLAHARTTILGSGRPGAELDQLLHAAKEELGSGLPALETLAVPDSPAVAVRREVERQPYDLVIVGAAPGERAAVAQQYLQNGEHHLLLLSEERSTPLKALICVASGEPGKEDILFSGRLARHLGAEATLLSVVQPGTERSERGLRAERFLQAGARTMALLGVPATTVVRAGAVRDEILDEMTAGGHDLLVLGAPLAQRGGRTAIEGFVGDILASAPAFPILIVRSHYAAARVARLVSVMGEEVIR
jgi:sulfate transport system ATP-binding protein